jgi:hypothetical protein
MMKNVLWNNLNLLLIILTVKPPIFTSSMNVFVPSSPQKEIVYVTFPGIWFHACPQK